MQEKTSLSPAESAIEETVSSQENKLVCVECSTPFDFSPEQQEDFKKRGFQPPKRCPECRLKRRKPKSAAPRKKVRQVEDEEGENLDNQGFSFVAQAEAMQTRRQEVEAPEDDDNFGNSVDYRGPGVKHQGSAWEDEPQYAPWEGAHGYLLTHHERMQKSRDEGKRKKVGGMQRGGQKTSSGRGRNERRKRQSTEIVCATCGITTQVPFKPIPGKPVYCQACYKAARTTQSVPDPERFESGE